MYASADRIDGKWSPLKEIGNNSTYGVQFNYVQQTAGTRETLGLWGFHWGAQYHHRDPDGTFTRISPATFNRGYASMNYFRFVEFHDQYGIIPYRTAGILRWEPRLCLHTHRAMVPPPRIASQTVRTWPPLLISKAAITLTP